jgi:hypothetical protein
MNEYGHVWQLVRGDELLAELVVTAGDFPWLNAQVRPVAGFEEVRPLFEEELRRLDHLDDDPAPWEAAYRRIRQAVCLLAPDGRPVPEFLLHIEGDNAWWRWSDEPFRQTQAELGQSVPSSIAARSRNSSSLSTSPREAIASAPP